MLAVDGWTPSLRKAKDKKVDEAAAAAAVDSTAWLLWRMRGLMRVRMAEPVSQFQILRRELGQERKHFPSRLVMTMFEEKSEHT